MVARIAGFLVLGLCVTPVAFGADRRRPWLRRVPCRKRDSTTAVAKDPEVSAGEHLRLAARQLEAAGRTNEAAAIRSAANQLDRRAKQELADLTRQIAQLQKKSERLQQLLGRPNQIAYKCRFLELSAKSAAEFYAAAGLAEPEHEPVNAVAPPATVCLKAAEVFRMLREAGKLATLAELSIITRPDQSASATTGGEFPVPTAGTGSRLSFVYRRFGYRCDLEPTLLDSGRVRLEADPEIAERDITSSVEFNGLAVPSVTTRRMHLTVEMDLGDSLVINMGTRPQSEAHGTTRAALEVVLQLVSGHGDPSASADVVTLVLITPTAAESCPK